MLILPGALKSYYQRNAAVFGGGCELLVGLFPLVCMGWGSSDQCDGFVKGRLV